MCIQTKNWIRIVSAGISGTWKKPITKYSTDWDYKDAGTCRHISDNHLKRYDLHLLYNGFAIAQLLNIVRGYALFLQKLKYPVCHTVVDRALSDDGVKVPTIEFSYKNDEWGDPLINSYFAVALELATWEEIETIKNYAFKVNDVLKAYFLQAERPFRRWCPFSHR